MPAIADAIVFFPPATTPDFTVRQRTANSEQRVKEWWSPHPAVGAGQKKAKQWLRLVDGGHALTDRN